MNIKAYLTYFIYVCKHKKNVFVECMKEGLYLRALTHDLSKFKPSEFLPCVRYFYIDKNSPANKSGLEEACYLHYKSNPHHPEHHLMYHIVVDGDIVESLYEEMPLDDIREMICDLKATSREFGWSAQEYYLNNYHKFGLNHTTRVRLDSMLGLTKKPAMPICKCEACDNMSLYDLACAYGKDGFNTLIKTTINQYPDIDIYEIIKNKKE